MEVRYEANGDSGWYAEGSLCDDTPDATWEELVEELCDEIEVEAPEDDVVAAYFYDTETDDEVAYADIDGSARTISMNEGYRE